MKVVVHQPDFAPWLGFFDRLLDADAFVVLDDVQFLRRGWHHRDKIKTRRGADWLTLPVEKCPRETPINRVNLRPARDEWVPAALALIAENYREAAHFGAVFPRIRALFERPWERLIEINLAFLDLAYEMLDLRPRVRFASEFGVATARSRRLLDLVMAAGGNRYLAGTGSLDYLDFDLFRAGGVDVEVRTFAHPVYPQLHGDFVPGLSCLDLFLNCGPDSAKVLRQGRVPARNSKPILA
ncbi:MAG: WbqC family protein [Rhodospirillales bacterium]|nr:WbqC family protein [Rhodospirillales bacterium]